MGRLEQALINSLYWLIAMSALVSGTIAFAADSPVRVKVDETGIPYEYSYLPGKRPRILHVGDIHGDLQAYLTILRHAGVLNDQGEIVDYNWIIAQQGDLLDGAAASPEVLYFQKWLEGEMKSHGGMAFALHGNHEVINAFAGNSHMQPEELSLYRLDLKKGEQHRQKQVKLLRSLLEEDPSLHEWFLNRNVFMKIDNQVFVHAGPTTQMRDAGRGLHDLGKLNARARKFFNVWFGFEPKSKHFKRKWVKPWGWLVGMDKDGKLSHDIGPLFSRDFSQPREQGESSGDSKLSRVPKGQVPNSMLEDYARQLGGDVVDDPVLFHVGHAPTPTGVPAVPVSNRGRVRLWDTGISYALKLARAKEGKDGKLSYGITLPDNRLVVVSEEGTRLVSAQGAPLEIDQDLKKRINQTPLQRTGFGEVTALEKSVLSRIPLGNRASLPCILKQLEKFAKKAGKEARHLGID